VVTYVVNNEDDIYTNYKNVRRESIRSRIERRLPVEGSQKAAPEIQF
jgi:hypothetical protein